jgi:Flp pilus assembly pilin Flp
MSRFGIQRLLAAGLGREEGQTFVEYAMVLALIAVTMATALTFLHDKIDAFYTYIGSAMP